MTERAVLWAPRAWTPGGWREKVVLRVDRNGRWSEVETRAWEVLANEGRIRMHAARGRAVADILAECGAF